MPMTKEKRREYERIRNQRRYQERKAAGVCRKCGRDLDPKSQALCTHHRQLDNARSITEFYRKKDMGLCVTTGCVSIATHGIYCERHREKTRIATQARYKERLRLGVCVDCGKNELGRHRDDSKRLVRCQSCHDVIMKSVHKHRERDVQD